MKQFISLLISALVFSFCARAQTVPGVEWEKCISNTTIRSAVTISDNAFTIAGESKGCDDSSQIGLKTYNKEGSLLWEKVFIPSVSENNHVFSLSKTDDHGYLIAGSIDSFANNFNWLLKTDSAGIVQWQKQFFFCDTARVLYGKAIQLENGNILYLTELYLSRRDVQLMMFDSNGNILWTQAWGGSLFDYAGDVVEADDNGFLIAAYTNSTDGDITGNKGAKDIWIIKLNSEGDLVWEKCYGGNFNEESRSVLKLSDGYLVGGMSESINADVSGHHGSSTYYDLWVFKIDLNGSLIWNKSFGGINNEYAAQMIPLNDGNFLITGSSYSSDYNIIDHHKSVVFGDQWTIKFKGDGTIIWQKSTGGSSDDWSNCATALDSGEVIIAGASLSNDGDHHNGCFDNDCRPVEGGWLVKLNEDCPSFPTAIFTFSQYGQDFTFTNLSYDAISYTWDFGDGYISNDTSPSHTYLFTGQYDVCLTAHDSCASDIFCISVSTCTTIPIASFGVSYPDGVNIYFTDSSSNAISWNWDFGDGNYDTSQNPIHSYTQNGTYSVTLTIQDSCGNISSQIQTVNTCNGFNTDFNYTVSGGIVSFSDSTSGLPSTWSWDFGDGNFSSSQDPQHTYLIDGTYLVCLTAASIGCPSQTTCESVYVCIPPAIDSFSFTAAALFISFYDSSESATSWEWNFGDGSFSIEQNPQHTYLLEGVYDVCEIVSNNCMSDTICETLVIGCPSVQALFGYITDNLSVSFSDLSINSTAWEWDFGDGSFSTEQNPVHAYEMAGDYNVCLIAGDGCASDTFCSIINAECLPANASFTYSAFYLDVSFTGQSDNATQWEWDFGDGDSSSLENPSHQYSSAGTYHVCLIAGNNCSSDTFCQDLIVECSPFSAAFTWLQSNDTVSFFDQSVNSIQWQWDFGDGSLAFEQNPVHDYNATGNYFICLIAFDGCTADTACDSVFIIADALPVIEEENFYLNIFPNPLNDFGTISFFIPQSSEVCITLYDITGKVTAEIIKEKLNNGNYSYKLSIENLSAGSYFLKLKSDQETAVRKITIQ